MPSKIEISLNQDQLVEFLKRCAQLKGAKLKDIQALAEEFGIDVSLMAARSFKQTAFQDYLDELKAKREMAESVSLVAKEGLDLSAAAASALAAKVFDASINLDPSAIGTEQGNNVSLAVARLQAGRRGDKKLEADLRLRDEQIQKLERDRTEWEEKRIQITAQVERAKNAPAATADEVRAAAVAEIDRIMGLKSLSKK